MSFLNKYNRAEENASHNSIKIGSAIYRIGDLINNNGLHCNFISKLDQNGVVIWEKSYYYSDHKVSVHKIIECTTNGDFLLFGTSADYSSNMYLFRINSSGNVIWKKMFNNNFYYQETTNKAFRNIISLGNENYILAFTDTSDENSSSIALIKSSLPLL